MKRIIFIGLTCLFSVHLAFSQSGKPVLSPPTQSSGFQVSDFKSRYQPSVGVPTQSTIFEEVQYNTLGPLVPPARLTTTLKIAEKDEKGLPIFIHVFLAEDGNDATSVQQFELIQPQLQATLPNGTSALAFQLVQQQVDDIGMFHHKYQQTHLGIPIDGAEWWTHGKNDQITHMNGRLEVVTSQLNAVANISVEAAMEVAKTDLSVTSFLESSNELLWFSKDGTIHLVWAATVLANPIDRYTYYIDAQSGVILHRRSLSCSLYPHQVYSQVSSTEGHQHAGVCSHAQVMDIISSTSTVAGPATATAQDLKNINRTVNVYEKNGTYFMLDAARPMVNNAQSNFPDSPVGGIWTIDAQNQAASGNGNYNLIQITSNNNTWNNKKAISAHYNAGIAYDYFRATHGRNSINGAGGNIISIINVTEDGTGMDNAFWNGAAMFYGNGADAFNSPLAKSLDVAGHEMSHGVIQSTANLVYENQPGALNESFADVFGVLIDDANWKLGEDVVNTSIFPSGALRDVANPNNGGSGLNSNGWQPASMSQYVQLPNTAQGDNGGVHINSGIPNRAFYLFANVVGRAKAGKVYYRALDSYLTASSQFIDCRLAVIQAATDLHGAGSAEVNAAIAAFDQVGIMGGQGTNNQTDLPINPGQELILAVDQSFEGVYLFDGTNVTQISASALLSRPSITDDGSVIMFVANDNTLRFMTRQQNGSYVEDYLENDPQAIWRNVAVSKKGERIVATTTDNDNTVFVYDFARNEGRQYTLTNPTTAQGISTGDVEYADVLEWDYSGENVMYDAYNVLNNLGTTIDYWDIGFVKVWNASANTFAAGRIEKLFNGLPENSSVGNPTFAKVSPFIVAFDYLDGTSGSVQYEVLGANLETGDVGLIYSNTDLGWPSYSPDDKEMVFETANSTGSTYYLDIIQLAANKISATGQSTRILNEAKWGTWFATGSRPLATGDIAKLSMQVFPNPFVSEIQIQLPENVSGTVSFECVDLTGKVLLSEKNAAQSTYTLILPTNLPKGTYVLKVVSEQGIGTQMIVKQ